MRKSQRGYSVLLNSVLVLFAALTPALTMSVINWHDRSTHEQRAAVPATPLVQTDAISLSLPAVAVLKAYGIKQLAAEPIGTSTASFNLLVNGQVIERTYSTISSLEQMYRIDMTSGEPKVFVTESIRKSWEPSLVAFVLEKELLAFDENQRKQAQLHEQWSADAKSGRS